MGWEGERVVIDRKSGVGGERVGIDKSGMRGGESGNRQEEGRGRMGRD